MLKHFLSAASQTDWNLHGSMNRSSYRYNTEIKAANPEVQGQNAARKHAMRCRDSLGSQAGGKPFSGALTIITMTSTTHYLHRFSDP